MSHAGAGSSAGLGDDEISQGLSDYLQQLAIRAKKMTAGEVFREMEEILRRRALAIASNPAASVSGSAAEGTTSSAEGLDGLLEWGSAEDGVGSTSGGLPGIGDVPHGIEVLHLQANQAATAFAPLEDPELDSLLDQMFDYSLIQQAYYSPECEGEEYKKKVSNREVLNFCLTGNPEQDQELLWTLSAMTGFSAKILARKQKNETQIWSAARWKDLRTEEPYRCELQRDERFVLPCFARLVMYGRELQWVPLDTLFAPGGGTLPVSIQSATPSEEDIPIDLRSHLMALDPMLRERYGVGLDDLTPLLELTFDRTGNVWGRSCAQRGGCNVYRASRDTLLHSLPLRETDRWDSLVDREILFHSYRQTFENANLLGGISLEAVDQAARASVVVIPLLPHAERVAAKGGFGHAMRRGSKEKDRPFRDMPLVLELLPCNVFSVFFSRYDDPCSSEHVPRNVGSLQPRRGPRNEAVAFEAQRTSDGRVRCPVCGKSVKRIVRHISRVHPEFSQFQCGICGRSTLNSTMQERHETQCRLKEQSGPG